MRDDLRFDQLLTEDIAALPPADTEVSPWREAMNRVLWGIGLTTITLNVWCLDMLLPAIGAMLMVLGFRTLRRENRFLRWCYGLSIAAAVVRGAVCVLAALPVETYNIPAYIIILLTLALYVCLWRGMVAVSRAAGAEKPGAPAAGWLVIFYAAMFPLACVGLEGWLAVLPLLALYIVILRSLVKLSRSLADTGYAITASPVRLSPATILWGGLGLLAAVIVAAVCLWQRYPMDWQQRNDLPQQDTICAALLALDFPQEVLDDLTADEVAELEGAVAVYTKVAPLYDGEEYRTVVTDQPVDENRWNYQRAVRQEDGSYRNVYRVYDLYSSVMTHVVVRLAEENGVERFVMIHHLRQETEQEISRTEGMELWPVWQLATDWSPGRLCSGRVLCRCDGQEQTAAFYKLESGSYAVSNLLRGGTQSTILASWSLPHSSSDGRAYVMYDAYYLAEEGSVFSHVTYVRQTQPVYPFSDVLSNWRGSSSDSVSTSQTAIQEWLSD